MKEPVTFLTAETARRIRALFGTPAFVYDMPSLKERAREALGFPAPYGLTVRYAMKAAPNRAILQLFDQLGLGIDVSSGHEAWRAIDAGLSPEKISISSQEYPDDMPQLHGRGLAFNACSLSQLQRYGESFPGTEVGLRFNPGIGSGSTHKTNVGGPSSSFGIWHEHAGEVQKCLDQYQLTAMRIHTHIGSGSDPQVWLRTAELSLALVRQFPDVRVLNMGGGYKVGRMPGEASTDLQEIAEPVSRALKALADDTGRKLHLEIEPGTYLVGNSCVLLSTVQDTTNTGANGYRFLKLDSGMTEILRPALYAAQHPIEIYTEEPTKEQEAYVVVGHCCESGDLLTPSAEDPEQLGPRTLTKAARGDMCVIGGAGAYVSSMCAKHYNAFPEAPEVLLDMEGEPHLIRRREEPEEVYRNECEPEQAIWNQLK